MAAAAGSLVAQMALVVTAELGVEDSRLADRAEVMAVAVTAVARVVAEKAADVVEETVGETMNGELCSHFVPKDRRIPIQLA